METFLRLLPAALLLLWTPGVEGQPPQLREVLKAASDNARSWSGTLAAGAPESPGKISASLREVANLYEADSERTLAPVASRFDLPFEGQQLFVKLTAIDEGSAGRLRSRIRDEGGEVMAVFHETVFARLPPRAIGPLGESPWLARMSPQESIHTGSAPLTTPPDTPMAPLLAATLVDQLHAKGITGKGSKVGILEPIDSGYNEGQHGDMVSTIISAIAPDSERFRETYTLEGEFVAAVDRLVADGVQIINHSAGWEQLARNGHSLMDQKVNEVTAQHNILWVNAAGNEAKTHWSVTRNPYAGGFLTIVDNLANSPTLLFKPHTNEVNFIVTWDDWGSDPAHPSPSADLLAILSCVGQVSLLETSHRFRDTPGPVVGLYSKNVVPGQQCGLILYASHWPKSIRVHIDSDARYQIDSPSMYCPPTSMRHPPGEDSVETPGTAAGSLTVGAIELSGVHAGEVADYSSLGPTDEPRQKPDVSAYSNIQSDWLPRSFSGTSAAAPVVAGIGALLVQMLMQNWSAASGRAWLLACADRQPKGKSGPNISGQGIVTASRLLAELNHTTSPHSLELSPDPSNHDDTADERIDRLRESASEPQPFEVRLALGKSSYRIGDGLKLGYMSSQTAYFAIFHSDGAGHYTRVTSSGAGAEPLEPGRSYVFPQGDQGQIQVTGPPGEEEFLFVCSKEPVDWDSLPRSLPERSPIAVALVRFTIRQ
jgi:hypothetical protein